VTPWHCAFAEDHSLPVVALIGAARVSKRFLVVPNLAVGELDDQTKQFAGGKIAALEGWDTRFPGLGSFGLMSNRPI
jgi:hypothetical protein